MRYMRERPAIRQQHLPRAQRYAAPVERESASGESAGERRSQEATGLHQLHQERENRQGVAVAPGFAPAESAISGDFYDDKNPVQAGRVFVVPGRRVQVYGFCRAKVRLAELMQ